jgi:hypothetical protein
LVRQALRKGLPATSAPESIDVSPDVLRLCELAVLRASGLFDSPAYVRANRDVRRQGVNALEHFVDEGWRKLRNPSRAFDVWWYWTEYLDPANETVNPLLHFALVGAKAGFAPLPPVEGNAQPTRFASGTRPTRICLFAGFDPHGVVDEYVVAYVEELSRHADVYYLADGYMESAELDKLAHCVKGAWAQSHGAYDFGSYSILAKDLVGWDVIDGYDELLLVNDSGFLLRSLDGVFDEMDRRACDWWGLQATRHDFTAGSNDGRPLPLKDAKATMIGERTMDDIDHLHVSSYFLVYRRKVHSDPGFRRRLESVTPQADKHLVIYKYEIGFSRYLMCRGFEVDTFIPDLYPFHPLYTEQYFDLLRQGFPLLKRNFLSENSRDVPDLVHWKDLIVAEVPDAPLEVLERNLERVSPDDRLRRSFSIVADADGDVPDTRPYGWWQVAEQDRAAPTYDHWWAFPVDGHSGQLTSDQRSVFECLRDDPAVRKVILSRSRRVDLDGRNVDVVPLGSRDGQEAAFRSRVVVVGRTPRVSVPFPLSPRRHRFVHVDSASRMEYPERVVAEHDADALQDSARVSLAVATSHSDVLPAAAYVGGLSSSQVLTTGAPRHDLLFRPVEELPDDLREQEHSVVRALQGRRLLLLLPRMTPTRWSESDAHGDGRQLAELAAWCDRNGYLLGYQDVAGDRHMRLSRALRPLGAVRFDRHAFPHVEPLLRAATAIVSDGADAALDAALLGRHVVLVGAEGSREDFLMPPGERLSDSGVTTTESLRHLVDRLRAEPTLMEGTARRSQRAGCALLDDQNGLRLVRALRRESVSGQLSVF